MNKSMRFVLMGLAFAGGTLLPTSCNSAHREHGEKGRESRGEKHEANEADEMDEDNEREQEHAQGEQAKEETMPLAQAPEAVRAAAAKLASAQDIVKVERATEDGSTSFEIEYMAGGRKCSATLTERGEVMELEKPAELPEAAKAAIARVLKGAKILTSESVEQSFYEVVVERNGEKFAVKVFANGMIESKEEVEEE